MDLKALRLDSTRLDCRPVKPQGLPDSFQVFLGNNQNQLPKLLQPGFIKCYVMLSKVGIKKLLIGDGDTNLYQPYGGFREVEISSIQI